MNKKVLLALILILTAIVMFLLPNDRKKIFSNLDTLAEYCSSASGETSIGLIKKVAQAGKLCKNPCMIQLKSYDINRALPKKELTDHILMMKRMMPETEFSFHDTTITFPQKKHAVVSTTLRLSGKINSDRFTDAYELSINTEKINGKWLFSSFSIVEFMEQ